MPVSHGCPKPTNVEDLYLLSGIAPPAIRRNVCARVERQKQSTRETLSLFGHIPVARRLKSRHCFLLSVQPANFPDKVIRCSEWRKKLRNKSYIDIISLHEELEKGHDSPWTTWRCLNRLRTGYTCSGKIEEITAHMLQCSQLAHPCSLDDLIMFNDIGKQCTELLKRMV